jgi:anti-anti-sigma factor
MKFDPASQFLAVWQVTDGRRSLCLSGELDLATAPLLEEALAGEIEPGMDLTFVVDHLRLIDAAGLKVLVGVRRSIGSRGRVLMRDPARSCGGCSRLPASTAPRASINHRSPCRHDWVLVTAYLLDAHPIAMR